MLYEKMISSRMFRMEVQAPRVNGRHASMDATRQWMPRVNGCRASMDATRQWMPRLCKRRMLNQHVPPYEKKYHFVESTLVERGKIIEK